MGKSKCRPPNEAELRARVVDVWLAARGFSPDEILLESSFRIRLGRNVYVVGATGERRYPAHARGRADYLVRTVDGRNLFVVETKSPSEDLDEEMRDQAISYARLVADGDIAPFAILTNGRNAEIYDTVTRELISNEGIPAQHTSLQHGFRATV